MDSEGESRSLSKILVMIFQFLQGFLADPNVRSIMSVVNDWVPCRGKKWGPFNGSNNVDC